MCARIAVTEKRIIIAGGRNFAHPPSVHVAMQPVVAWVQRNGYELIVVSGGAQGADMLGECWAKKNNVRCELYPAQWNTHGRKAGYLRNQQMAGVADGLLAFWDGKSRGTMHMINIARDAGLDVQVVNY